MEFDYIGSRSLHLHLLFKRIKIHNIIISNAATARIALKHGHVECRNKRSTDKVFITSV